MSRRKAIIPAAGLGTRLRPVTEKIPKVLIHVGDKPTIGHIISLVEDVGITDVVLIVGYLGEMVIDYVKDAFPKISVDFVEQKELKGLGHAIWLTREKAYGDEILIVYGDTILEAEIRSAFSSPGDGSLGVKWVDDPSALGVAVLEGNRVVRLVEKPKIPPSNLALVGVNYFKDSAMLYEALNEIVTKDIRTRGEVQATDAFDLMVKRGAYLTTFEVKTWLDCGTVENLLQTNRFVLGKAEHYPRVESIQIIPPVYLGKGALVKDCRLGPFVSVAPGASVFNCVLEDCIVERTARLEGISASGKLFG